MIAGWEQQHPLDDAVGSRKEANSAVVASVAATGYVDSNRRELAGSVTASVGRIAVVAFAAAAIVEPAAGPVVAVLVPAPVVVDAAVAAATVALAVCAEPPVTHNVRRVSPRVIVNVKASNLRPTCCSAS